MKRSSVKKKQIDIEKIIPYGKENAIHQEEISKLLGVSDQYVKTLIQKAREDGSYILSDTCGYWIAQDSEEVREFIDRSEKNAYRRLKTVRTIKKSLKISKGQKRLKIGGEKNDRK